MAGVTGVMGKRLSVSWGAVRGEAREVGKVRELWRMFWKVQKRIKKM
jgi:hypothetical protein